MAGDGLARITLASTTAVSNNLALAGMAEWENSGVGLLKGLLYNFMTRVDLPFNIGTSASKHTLVAATPWLDVYTTSAATTGALQSVIISQTMTAASTANQVEVLKVQLVSDVKTGAWAQAIFAQTDYSTNGLAHGSGSVICAELSLPASTVVRGTYYVWQSEIDCPASCAMSGNPIGVMSVSVWGTNKTQFDDVGLLFDISGVTSGATKFWYDNTDGAYDEWLKVRTPSGVRYIPLMDGQAA